MANHRFGLYRSNATIKPPAWSACNDSAENWADATAPSCFKVRKQSRAERSKRHGLSFPVRGQVIFPGCAARAALKVTLEKGPTDGWITGLNDAGTSIDNGSHGSLRCAAQLTEHNLSRCSQMQIYYWSIFTPVRESLHRGDATNATARHVHRNAA